MQLPIDVKALIDEMTDIEAARNTPLSVSVFIDEAAPADLAAHVRNAFASTMPLNFAQNSTVKDSAS